MKTSFDREWVAIEQSRREEAKREREREEAYQKELKITQEIESTVDMQLLRSCVASLSPEIQPRKHGFLEDGELKEAPDHEYEVLLKQATMSLARLVYELKEHIFEYDTLLSDETSGRIPTLILRGAINEARTRQGVRGIPNTFFVPSGKYATDFEEAKEFLKKKPIKKALVVTELLSEGGTMQRLTNALSEIGITFDVASLFSYNSKSDYPQIKGEHVYIGKDNDSGAYNFFNNKQDSVARNGSKDSLIGVRNDVFDDNFGGGKIVRIEDTSLVPFAREVIAKMSKELSKLIV